MTKPCFERLPGEIIAQIIEVLEIDSPSSVFKLLLIRATRDIAERFIYKSVTVSASGPEHPLPYAKRLIDRILDPDDSISGYIQKLVIDQQSGTQYPEIFRGHLPKLKALSFVVTYGANLRTIGKFLDTTVGLEELQVNNAYNGFYPILWSRVKTLGSTLRILKTDNMQHAAWRWTSGALIELSEALPKLENLAIDLALVVKVKEDYNNDSFWPTDSFRALSRCARLNTLKMAIRLPYPGPPSLTQIGLMTEMFLDFFRHDPRSQMRTLELTTGSAEMVPIQDVCIHYVIVTVKRLENESAPSPLDGGFEGSIEWKDGRTGEVRKNKF